MRTLLEPRLVDPTAFEPGLVIDVRDERQALLIDLGRTPRVLRARQVFVTHTQMDHFAGLDHLPALVLGRVPRPGLWGGPGFCEQVGHQLAAYTWNVVQRDDMPLPIAAHALLPDGSRREVSFDSRQAFHPVEPTPPEVATARLTGSCPDSDQERVARLGTSADPMGWRGLSANRKDAEARAFKGARQGRLAPGLP